MAIELCLIGILNVWTDRPAVAWTQAILTLVWTFTFQLSAGQLGKFVTLLQGLGAKTNHFISSRFRMGSPRRDWINSSPTEDNLSCS